MFIFRDLLCFLEKCHSDCVTHLFISLFFLNLRIENVSSSIQFRGDVSIPGVGHGWHFVLVNQVYCFGLMPK
jgi:hypothetical protein